MTDINIDSMRPNLPIKTSDSKLNVEMGDSPLGVGQHQFSLTVADTSGNQSTTVNLSLIVKDDQRPTAVLDVRDAQTGRLIPNNTISFGSSFQLSAARSVDPGGGSIKTYEWRRLD